MDSLIGRTDPALPDRRMFLLGATALAGCALAPPHNSARSILEEAVKAAGGLARLEAVQALRWTGTARIHAAQDPIDIGVSTRVVPFTSARSDTWLLSEGPTRRRSMVIEPSRAWTERDGKVSPLPQAMAVHERAQYGVYGLMLLAPLLTPPAIVQRAPREGELECLDVQMPPAPRATLCFDQAWRLVRLRNRVSDAEGQGSVDQLFKFAGEMRSNGVRWPREISIEQNGRPYFDMTLATFEVELKVR